MEPQSNLRLGPAPVAVVEGQPVEAASAAGGAPAAGTPAGGVAAGRLVQFGRQASVAFTEKAVTAGAAIQGSKAGQSWMDATTRVCSACQTRMFRMVAYECGECGGSCCQGCVTSIRLWNPRGESSLTHPGPFVQVCKACVPKARQQVRKTNVEERMKRVNAFLEGRLEPYKYSPESKTEQSLRIGGHVMHGLKNVTDYIPIAGTAVRAINAGYYIVRYGPLVLIGNDVVLALQMLVALATKLDLLPVLKATPQDFFGGLYYMMGEHAGERGKTPELEYLEHLDRTGSAPTPKQELLLRLRHLVRLLFCTRTEGEPTPTDAQRLFKQVLPGSELLLGELSTSREIPSYFVVATRKDKDAYLVLPGTRNASDVATDVNAEEEDLLHGSAHKGMVGAARWLLGEVAPVLVHLYTQGFKVTIVGHSLGAAVAALLTVMLRPQISTIFCYGFGMPACVDERLMTATVDCIVSVVNRDDLVPRLTVQNVEGLCNSALCTGQVAKTKAWMDEDWKAVQDYKRVLEFKRREEPSATAVQQEGIDAASSNDQKVELLVEAGLTESAAKRALELEGGDVTRALLRGTEEEVEEGSPTAASNAMQPAEPAASSSANPTLQQNLEQGTTKFLGLLQNAGAKIQAWSADAATTAGTQAQHQAQRGAVAAYTSTAAAKTGGSQHHTRFFIPGQVVHIYNQNGLGRAAFASSTDAVFARINVCANMLQDHKVASYDAAVRQACILDAKTPKWESFEERVNCACCGADFNWACVLQSEPQRMLARNNCFKCGRVVCEGCSHTRQAWPQLGAISAVRTCDACVFGPEND